MARTTSRSRQPIDPLLAIATRVNLRIETEPLADYTGKPIGHRVLIYREPHGAYPLGLVRVMPGDGRCPTVTDVLRELGLQAYRLHKGGTLDGWAALMGLPPGRHTQATYQQERREVTFARGFFGPRAYAELAGYVRCLEEQGDVAAWLASARVDRERAPGPEPLADLAAVLEQRQPMPPGFSGDAEILQAIADDRLQLDERLADWVFAKADARRVASRKLPGPLPDDALAKATDRAYAFIGCPF